MKLLVEKVYPYVFSILASIIWYELDIKFPSSDSVLSSTLTIAGIFIGFLTTSKALLISIDSPVLNDLRQSGYIKDLTSYMKEAIWGNLIFCIINIIGYFLPISKGGPIMTIFGLIWIFFCVCSLATFFRVTDIMLKFFEYSSRGQK